LDGQAGKGDPREGLLLYPLGTWGQDPKKKGGGGGWKRERGTILEGGPPNFITVLPALELCAAHVFPVTKAKEDAGGGREGGREGGRRVFLEVLERQGGEEEEVELLWTLLGEEGGGEREGGKERGKASLKAGGCEKAM
jgi:hypothetical protein